MQQLHEAEFTLNYERPMNTSLLDRARTHLQNGDLLNARNLYHKAIYASPEDASLHLALSSCLWGLGYIDEALVATQKACSYASPDFLPHALFQQAQLYFAQERYPNAAAIYNQLLNHPEFHHKAALGLSTIFISDGRPYKAIELLLPIFKGKDPLLTQNLAVSLFESGNVEDSLTLTENSMYTTNITAYFISNALMLSNYVDNAYQKSIPFKKAIPHFFPSHFPYTPHTKKNARLKVGFISPDLYSHPVGWFSTSFLPYLDRTSFEVIIFSNSPKQDFITQSLMQNVDNFISILNLREEEILEKLREECLDIIIDLAGHTKGNCLAVLSHRVAPIQISYLGYFASTFVPNIDYMITDRIHVLPNETHEYSEKIIYLPCSRFCYMTPSYTPPIAPLPALGNKEITFASFSNFSKLSPRCIALWSKVLLAIPNSRLQLRWKVYADPELKLHLWDAFKEHGITKNRIELYGYTGHEDLFAHYNEVDIALDTLPFSGATTSCEALWMGVPVLTLKGNTGVSRQTASILNEIGLHEWISSSEEEFINLAIQHTKNLNSLNKLRFNLREKMKNSTLLNGLQFARYFKETLENIFSK